MPVTFPPGRLRLATRPVSTGSAPTVNTIGIELRSANGNYSRLPELAADLVRQRFHAASRVNNGHPLATLRPSTKPEKMILVGAMLSCVGFSSSASSRPWKPTPAQIAADYASIRRPLSSHPVRVCWTLSI
jgi:hypothetical protein